MSCLFCYPVNTLIESCAAAGIRPIVCRQERVGMGMADGYSRISNRQPVGVFTMQHGPGGENAFSGVATAYSDSTPVLVLPFGDSTSRLGIRVHLRFHQNLCASVSLVVKSEAAEREVPLLTEEQNEQLRQVGPSTPMGDLLRRYWHPIAAATQLDENPVKRVKLLGESLVLYRDREGRLGLLSDTCAHRGVNLGFGRAGEGALLQGASALRR